MLALFRSDGRPMPWRRTQAPAPGSPTSSGSTPVRGSGTWSRRCFVRTRDSSQSCPRPGSTSARCPARRRRMRCTPRCGARPWWAGRPSWHCSTRNVRRAASTGRAGVATIAGPAGVGKSRLVAELAHRAAADRATVLVGRCDDPTPGAALVSAFSSSPRVRAVLDAAPDVVRRLLGGIVPTGTEAAGEAETDPHTRSRDSPRLVHAHGRSNLRSCAGYATRVESAGTLRTKFRSTPCNCPTCGEPVVAEEIGEPSFLCPNQLRSRGRRRPPSCRAIYSWPKLVHDSLALTDPFLTGLRPTPLTLMRSSDRRWVRAATTRTVARTPRSRNSRHPL